MIHFYGHFFRVLATCMLFAHIAHGQKQPLSLLDAVQLGLANNYDIKIEKQAIDVARNQNTWGQAGRYPELFITLSQGNTSRNIDNPTSFIQGTIFSNNLAPTATVNWVLFNGFRVNITKTRFNHLQAEAEGNANIIVQNTLQAIILGYYRSVFENEKIKVLKDALTLSRDKYEYVKIKKELGSAVTTEVLLEEGNYLTDSLNYVNQILVYRNSLRDLNFLMAVEDLDQEYVLVDDLDFEPLPYRIDDLVTKMEANNINLRTQYITQEILKDNYHLAKTDLYPQVSFNASYTYEKNRQNLESAQFPIANPERPLLVNARTISTGLNFNVSYMLFNGGRIKRAIKSTVIQYDLGNMRIDRLKMSLRRDIRSEFDLYENRVLIKSIAARRLEAREKNMELSLEQFKTGTINSFDYRLIQVEYLQAALANLEAVYNLIDSNTSLLRLTGGILEIIDEE